MTQPLRCGQIVWAEVADENGVRKARPVIIVTPDDRLTTAESLSDFRLGICPIADRVGSQLRARIDPLSDLRANVSPSEPATPARPYSFIEDIRRIFRPPPPATLVLVVITVVAFIGQVLGGSNVWQRAVGIIPANVADASSLLRISDGQVLPAWLTLFSYMFLHGGLFHLLANMVGLWMFGILAEPVMGTKRFALTYLAFGVISGITIVAIIPHWARPMVGASGSISGILGAFLALHFSERLGQRWPTVAVFVIEVIPLLAVGAWFITRKIPPEPDHASSVAWHLIPFLLAWYGVRIRKGLSRCAKPKRSS
jgi:membrane associated rhomboid family serine protease